MHTSAFKCYLCVFSQYWFSKISSTLSEILPWSQIFRNTQPNLKRSHRPCLSLIALKVAALYCWFLKLFLHMHISRIVFFLMWNYHLLAHEAWLCKRFCAYAREMGFLSSFWSLGCWDQQLSLSFGKNEATSKEKSCFLISDFLMSFLLQSTIPFLNTRSFKKEIIFKKNTGMCHDWSFLVNSIGMAL